MSRPGRQHPHRPPGRGPARRTRARPHRGRADQADRAAAGGGARTPPTRPRAGRDAPARSHAARWRRRGLLGVASLGLAVGLVWLLLAGPLLVVRSVDVSGTAALSADRVRVVAAVPAGANLLRLDVEAVEARVERLSRVADAAVDRSVTGTVQLAVTERMPVAVVPRTIGVRLVDATGTAFATVSDRPTELPTLRVPRLGPDAPTAVAAVTVLTRLPPGLRAQVRAVRADSPLAVTLELSEQRTVQWGAPAATRRKAAVLDPLLTRPGSRYDVSSPDLPTVQ